jgi:hypothetical protein
MVMKLWRPAVFTVIFATGTIPVAAQAGVALVTSRGALGPDLIDWGTTSGGSTPVGFVSANGIVGNTTSAGGFLQVRQQPGNFGGDFSPGDYLEFTGFDGPDITINFNTAVAGAGAQIQANAGGAFVARIAAFDGTTIWSFTQSGFSAFHNDGSAIFLGILSDSANLKWVRYTLDSATAFPQSFAINQVSLTDTIAGGVPEPASWAMMLVGFGMMGWALRRQKPVRDVLARRTRPLQALRPFDAAIDLDPTA